MNDVTVHFSEDERYKDFNLGDVYTGKQLQTILTNWANQGIATHRCIYADGRTFVSVQFRTGAERTFVRVR